ncbi:neurofilament medium polypeptide-like isoform X1 [Papaver somniferum]|uniref:neurofilament medium polypeptide-like isoform X1 n=1 Tax=Papaver somniferum TaxID=3469 RepID=UPI000E6F5764|nr:neurofilament medium polypeptide-like isoform X1 [Papaver somniferum]
MKIERIASNFSVEAILDLNDEDIQVLSHGAFSDKNPNKSMASAWINDDGTYEISANSESGEFVSAYGYQSGESIQVYAQSGFEKQVEACADDADTNLQQQAETIAGADKEEQEVEKDDGKQSFEQQEPLTGARKEEVEEKEKVVDDAEKEEEAARGHEVQENPRVEEHVVTKIEPTKTQIKSSPPISTFNPFDAIGKEVSDVDVDDDDDEEEEDENNCDD